MGKINLIDSFKKYLSDLNKKNGNKYDLKKSDGSVFYEYSDEFNEFAKSNNIDTSIFSGGINLLKLSNFSIDNNKISFENKNADGAESAENIEDGTVDETEDSEFISYFNDILNQEEYRNAIDADHDNNITAEELKAFLESMNTNSDDVITIDELTSAIKGIKDSIAQAQALPEAETVAQNINELSNPVTSGGGGSGSGGGVYGPVQQTDSTSTDYKSMSLDELKTQLTNKNSEVDKSKEALAAITNGSDSEVQKLKASEEEASKKLEEYKENNDNELSKKLEEYSNQEMAVNSAQQAVLENKQAVTLAQDKLNQATSNFNSASSALQTAENILSSTPATIEVVVGKDEKGNDITETQTNPNYPSAQTAVIQAQKAKEEAEAAMQAAQTEFDTVNGQTEGLETALTEQQEALAQIKEQMQEMEGYPEIQQFVENLETAKAATANYQTQAISEAQKLINTQRTDISEIESAIQTKKNENKEFEASGYDGAMKDLVSYFGNEYLSLLSKDQIIALQKQIKETGWSNTGNQPSKCLQCTWQYDRWIMGKDGRAQTTTSENKQDILDGVKEQLDNGTPVTLMVTTKAGSRHFVTVIGYNKSAAASGKKLQESDLLVIDSWAGEVDGMGGVGGEGGYRQLHSQNGKYRYDILV